MEYLTWSDFETEFKDFCGRTSQVFSKRSSTSVKTRNNQIKKRQNRSSKGTSKQVTLFPETMETEQYSASYWCTHGRVRATESTGLRTHSKQRSTSCQVRISATLVCTGMDQYKIRVSSKGTSHNHRVDPDVYKIYPQNRAVNDPSVLGTIDAMRKGGAKARGVLMYLRDATEGKEMTTLKDIHNLMARLKAE
eukprot:jgi/Phyca11/132442/e_gw1.167.5.1